jgi:hypothetical protein
MAIDSSLAKGIRKCNLRRLKQIEIDPPNTTSKTKWFKLQLNNFKRVLRNALYQIEITGKGKKTQAELHALEAIDNGSPLAYLMIRIKVIQHTADIQFYLLPAGVTKHAYERAIQMTGEISDMDKINTFLEEPMRFALMKTENLNKGMEGDSIYYGTEWGLFIFTVEDAQAYLNDVDKKQQLVIMKTLIPADRLDGKNLERWQAYLENES